jgi:DMSO/TMAO reductase YedYZ molybdopterin-dependent catalytic subunit
VISRAKGETDGERDLENPAFRALVDNKFADWKLAGGLVQQPADYFLAELRELPAYTQITRHDCMEGWSEIAKWMSVPLCACSPMCAATVCSIHGMQGLSP